MRLHRRGKRETRVVVRIAILVVLVSVGYSSTQPSARTGHHRRHRHQTSCLHRRHHAHHRAHARRRASCEPSRPFFAPTSIWNTPVAANARLDPNSTLIVTDLLSQIKPGNLGIATSSYGVPIYTVGRRQPTVRVVLDQGPFAAPLQQAFDRVPIPRNAQPAEGTDSNLVVYQPSSDRMWEFWRMAHLTDGWHASWGGRVEDVSTNPGYFQNMSGPGGNVLEQPSWGSTASSLALVGGVMTISELRAGAINHALALGITTTCAKVWAWPAQRTDGDSTAPACVPEGGHFRLNPKLNLAALHLPHFTLMMARAAQRYGIVINNRSDGFTFRGEDPTQYEQAHGYNPYFGPANQPGTTGALFNDWPNVLLHAFPWSDLQLVKMDLRDTPDMTRVIDRH